MRKFFESPIFVVPAFMALGAWMAWETNHPGSLLTAVCFFAWGIAMVVMYLMNSSGAEAGYPARQAGMATAAPFVLMARAFVGHFMRHPRWPWPT